MPVLNGSPKKIILNGKQYLGIMPSASLTTKNITENGTYSAEDDNADGYSTVSVNVSGGSSAIYLTQTEYDALTTEEKENGSIYFVEVPASEDWIFLHTSTGGNYEYSSVPEYAKYLVAAESLNNIMYASIHYTISNKASRYLTTEELSHLATLISMTSQWAGTQTINGSGTTTPSSSWSQGSNTDVLYLNATNLNNVGTKANYIGCKSHLFYKTDGVRRIYYMNKLWSEIVL